MKTIEMSEAMRLVKEGNMLSKDERIQLQTQRLRELVDYVRENSPYFAEHYEKIPKDYMLTDLPMTRKEELVSRYEEWVTDREIRMDNTQDFLNTKGRTGVLFLDKYSVIQTSGTTGRPLPMVRDDYHNKIHGAMLSQRLLGDNAEYLDHTKHKIATVIYVHESASSYNSYLRAKFSAPGYEHNMTAISITESIESIVEKLNEFQPETLTGYASVLVSLALEKKKGNLKISLKMIANSAELLTEEHYQLLKEAFGCPVKNNYCMTEGGEIAMTHNCGHLHINEDWVIVEPVDKQGNPVTDKNAWSDGILITDLTNYVQPIIRYYVSDRVRILDLEKECCQLPVLEIVGRVGGQFSLGKKTFMSNVLVAISEKTIGLCQFQYVQTDENSLQLRGTCAPGYKKKEVLGELARQVYEYFEKQGCENLSITWCDEPMIHNERGGKVLPYINQMKGTIERS